MNFTPEDTKKMKGGNGYAPQRLGFDNRRPFNLGLHSQNTEIAGGTGSPFHTSIPGAVTDTKMESSVSNAPQQPQPQAPLQFLSDSPFKLHSEGAAHGTPSHSDPTRESKPFNPCRGKHGEELKRCRQQYDNIGEDPEAPLKQLAKETYWYKVDGKTVTKTAYLAAHKKGVGDPNSPNFTDGKGLQTNDPDVHGRKAKGAKKQTKVKNQGTNSPLDFKSPIKQSIQDSTTKPNIRTDIKIKRKLTPKELEIQAANNAMESAKNNQGKIYDKSKANIKALGNRNALVSLMSGRG